MIIGVLTVYLYLPLCNSLKEKRRHLNSLKARLASGSNVSIAEVDDQDKWQRSVVALVHVGTHKPVVESALSHMIARIENFNSLQVLNYETEIIS